MSTINGILSNALTGLVTAQTALRTTANNVANVNTPGYSRQVVQVESLVAGSQGAGVRVAEIQRVADRFLELAALAAKSDTQRYSVMREFQDRLQGLLGRPDSQGTLNARLDKAFAAMADLALDPTDLVRRQAALSDIARFTDEVDRLAQAVQGLRAEASTQITETVQSINTALAQIQRLNPLIVKAKITNGELGPLQDQRDRALDRLSELIDIKPIELADGSISVATSSGVTLLDAALRQLEYTSPGVATASTNFPQITMRTVDPQSGALLPDARVLDGGLLSGRLRGLVELRDKDLPQVADNLGELARKFTDAINAIHNANSSIPAPASLAGRQTGLAGADLLRFTGTADFAVVDGQGTLVRKVTIDFSALPATTTLDDLITTVNTGLAGDGVLALAGGRLSFTASAGNGVVIADDPAAPSSRAGRGFSQFFGMNDLVTAQVPSQFETGFGATDPHRFGAGETTQLELRDASNRIIASYTLTISGTTFNDILADLNAPGALGQFVNFSLDGNGQMNMTTNAGFQPFSLRVVSDSTDRAGTGVTLTDLFGIKQGARANAARDLTVNPAIVQQPQLLATARFDRAVAIGQRAVTAGDARGAAALRDLQLSTLSFARAGSLTQVNANITQYAAFVLGETALMAERTTKAEEDSKTLESDVVQRRDSISGVNIDEELSNMVTFQNAYNAAARLLTTARELYDTLLATVQ
ncbi:MAG: flagellar hook-associated protein FlgK [Pseudomonadota bacterium]